MKMESIIHLHRIKQTKLIQLHEQIYLVEIADYLVRYSITQKEKEYMILYKSKEMEQNNANQHMFNMSYIFIGHCSL